MFVCASTHVTCAHVYFLFFEASTIIFGFIFGHSGSFDSFLPKVNLVFLGAFDLNSAIVSQQAASLVHAHHIYLFLRPPINLSMIYHFDSFFGAPTRTSAASLLMDVRPINLGAMYILCL